MSSTASLEPSSTVSFSSDICRSADIVLLFSASGAVSALDWNFAKLFSAYMLDELSYNYLDNRSV
jgi:hypothetical protein